MIMKYDLAATGGTFDIIHKGHLKLLSTSFELSKKVIIGLSSDAFALKKGKKIINTYEKRLKLLKKKINKYFPNREFIIYKLENDFGPAVFEKNVQALIVSEETKNQGKILNDLRKQRNLPPVDIIVIPLVMASDKNRISSTRIRNLEIDEDGNILN